MLHIEQTGDGPETVVLLHGMMGSAEGWWRVASLLAERGCRVLALDLPGHGRSGPDHGLTVERAADAVARTLEAASAMRPAVAMGHSFGGTVLAAAAGRIEPGLAVFVDPPFTIEGGEDREPALAEYASGSAARTVEGLRVSRPHYGERDLVAEATAAERFDPATAAALAAGPGGTWLPAPGAIVLRADPSAFVDDEQAAALVRRGVEVRSIPGAAHSVWYSHFDGFVAALPEVFAPASARA
ncbi:alpha/beta fold hydrolase [Agromyces archimandritae]|uniref:Alpha/beta fold hydrolase n=1 Tax=Agromyces archimandritae TaxID=2781962 RepID=A0A975FMD5_9MICO|nr:alpha/beta hydrolase family protein [Agromyces archimandritae]QTX04780.1 alpha/beta fold hydrolase [Agromyces archimandritae]